MNLTARTLETEGALEVARLMCIAARTAPKGRGVDELETLVLTEQDKDRLADEMQAIGEDKSLAFFVRDADNMRASAAVVLLGCRNNVRNIPNCGYCGFPDCTASKAAGAVCSYCSGDLGIACGSAAAMAADARVDTRIMFTAGKAALSLGLFSEDVALAFGMPLSVSGKSPYFDR
ncbi:MAG: ferredoxin [Spirochaetaceae bacterium]|nr:MAG: ferredoxin [Spirochaetaceae bacterium]